MHIKDGEGGVSAPSPAKHIAMMGELSNCISQRRKCGCSQANGRYLRDFRKGRGDLVYDKEGYSILSAILVHGDV